MVLAEMGVNPAGLRSKGLEEFDLTEYRLLINLSDHSLQGLHPPDGAVQSAAIDRCQTPTGAAWRCTAGAGTPSTR